MSGRASRAKGKRGQNAFEALLEKRDWVAAEVQAGKEAEDFLAVCPEGVTYAVEVKNTVATGPEHVKQAKEQARKRGKGVRWLLAWHIPCTSSWLIQRQGKRPALWHEADEIGGVVRVIVQEST